GHRAWPGRYCGLSVPCGTSCERVTACLFSFRRRSSRGGITARATATAAVVAGTARTITTRRTARTAFFVTRGGGFRAHFAVGRHVALVDPVLEPDDPVGSLGFREAVVDVRARRVQRHAAFAVPLGTSDLDAVQAAGGHDLDALGAQAHGVLHGAFHGAAEHDALFELLGDRVGDELRVGFRLADFLDVDVHGHAHQALQVGLQRFDVLAAAADHHARAGRVHSDAGVLGGA